MKFNPLILIGGTILVLVVVGLTGRMIESSGGNFEQAIPRLLGMFFVIALGGVVVKRAFFRQR